MAIVTPAQATGSISWNLPATMSYTPGTPIPVRVEITNPTDIDRSYQLVEQVLQGSTLLQEDIVPIEGRDWFVIPAGYAATIDGAITIGATDVTYRLKLLEQSTVETVGSVAVTLTGSGSSGTPGISFADIMGPMVGVMAMGLVAGMLLPEADAEDETPEEA